MTLLQLPFGLSGRIFRSPMPFSPYDLGQTAYAAFKANNIAVVVLLVGDSECLEWSGRDLRSQYANDGYTVIHLPIPDFGIPDRGQLERALADTLDHARAGRNVVIHCLVGVGRTGLFSACLARRVLGLSGDDAIAWVRRYVPHAVEAEAQRRFVGEDG